MKKSNPWLRLWELSKKEHRRLICSIAAAFLGCLCGMIPYFSAAQIIIGLVNNSKDLSFYLTWCGLGAIGYLMRTLIYNLALAMSHRATFSILKDIRQRILKKLARMPLGTIIDTASGKMKQIIVDQVENMETPLAHLLPEMTSNIVVPLCILIYLLVLDWRMALISLVSIPIGMLFMMMIMKNYTKDYEGAVQVTQTMNSSIVEYIDGIEVIKAFNQGRNSYTKFADRVKANAAYYYNWMKQYQLLMSLSKVISPTAMITVLPFGWLMYNNRSISIEVFITTIILSLGVAGPILAAIEFIDSLAKVGTIVGSVDEILQGEEQKLANKPVKLKNMDIFLEDVSFGYHLNEEILHNVNLFIPSGSMTALVGPSGSGKSTIAKLIAGFWDVSHGKVFINGVNERDIPLEQLYNQIAFVSQDNYLFDETIRDNIRMGRISATDTEVEAVARAAGCDDFIQELENGYDTKVGEGGAHLSGGERQRIAIARAMLKDAPIVILDEATAYIDPENESIIQKAVAQLVQEKTVIVIAHRLSTITDADQIFVVKNGKIVADGTHESLLKSCALYKSMWQAHIGAKDGAVA